MIGQTRSGSHKIGFEERLDVLRFHHVRTNHRLVALLCGAIAQLEERLICIQEVVGSIPSGSTNRDFHSTVQVNGAHSSVG